MRLNRLFIAITCALIAGVGIRLGVQKFSVFGPLAGHTEALKEPAPAYLRSLHPKYPYSIIPGGAYSPSELQRADLDDDVVKAHYADFDVKSAKMVKLTDDRFQYVSYRKQNKVYWTKKKLRLPKGELLLTDGSSWARARCGNRLSDTPRSPVSENEPPAKELAMPPMEPGMPMELAETIAPSGPLSSPLPIERFPPVIPPDSVTPPPELPPLSAAPPWIPPSMPPAFAPPVITAFPPVVASLPPAVTPPVVPPATVIPPVIPPSGETPASAVPEPQAAAYLFLVAFVVSLYGLTRMIPAEKNAEGPAGKEK